MFLGMTCRIVKPIALLLGLSAILVACVDNSNNIGGTSQYLTVANQKSAEHGLQLTGATDYSTSTLRDVAKGNGIYVVVGDNGVIITSKDGSTWQTQGGVVSTNLSGVTYNPVNKLFYAVGDAGLIISSADGVTWTIYKKLTPSVNLNSIMSVKGDEIIAGESGNVFEVAVTSKRGMITVRGLDAAINATATSFNGSDMMVVGTAAGELYYKTYSTFSTSNWTKTNTLTNMPVSDISYDSIDSWFTATTLNGAVIQSSDGKSWSSPILVNSAGSINLNSIALEPLSNNFIVAGSDAAQKPYTRFSYDFNQWSDYSVAAQSQIQKIRCFDGSSCVAVGDYEALSFASKESNSSGMAWTAIVLNPVVKHSGSWGIAFSGAYAYITKSSNGYLQCGVNANGLNSKSCTFVKIASLRNVRADGITTHGAYAYITDTNKNGYYRCSLTATGLIDPNSCVENIPTVDGGLTSPYSVTISNNYAYFSNFQTAGAFNNGHYYTRCDVINDVIESSSCTNIAPKGEYVGGYSMAVNHDYALFSKGRQCKIDNTGLSSCSSLPFPSGADSSNYVTYHDNYAYTLYYASGSSGYNQCALNPDGSVNTASCGAYIPLVNKGNSGFRTLNFNGNYAYFISYDGSYTQCNVNANGIDSTSCKTALIGS